MEHIQLSYMRALHLLLLNSELEPSRHRDVDDEQRSTKNLDHPLQE